MTISSTALLAPVSGVIVPLSGVPDAVFAEGMMGEGMAIEPVSGQVLAPADGVIHTVARTAHALTLTTTDGIEVLIHLGIDTVKLGGEGFSLRVAAGDIVHAGQCLIEMDLDRVAQGATSLVTLVLLPDGGSMVPLASGPVVAGRDRLCSVALAGSVATAETTAEAEEARAGARVLHEGGLHARPAAMVQAAARDYASDVQVEFRGQRANARSVVALMGLGVAEEDEVTVLARGVDARAAAEAVIAALQVRSRSAALAPELPVVAAVEGVAGIAGTCAAPGLAIGRIHRLDTQPLPVREQAGAGADELGCLEDALADVRAALRLAIDAAVARKTQAEHTILVAHLALADDPELINAAQHAIQSGVSASVAVRDAIEAQCRILLGLGNPMLAERVGDLRDLGRRILVAMGMPEVPAVELSPESIVVADDLLPSDLGRFPREALAGLVLVRGGATSHLAIIARSLGVPMLVAVGDACQTLQPGQQVVLDASAGRLDAMPDAARLLAARERINARQDAQQRMLAEAMSPVATRDGVAIDVAANVANERDAKEAVQMGADSVGLLRTELLFIERDSMPDRAEQQRACQAVVDAMAGRPVIIRTLDVGGDKDMPYLPMPPEDNPALGLRGIRTGFARPDVLDVQLRALLALQPLDSVRILLPMIADVGELRRVRGLIDQLCAELGITARPQLGVMIEVPSAAVLADQLAAEADFLSIGTNDLTQYTLAMDRCHAGLADRLDPFHPALLRLIAMTVEGAARHGKWVGVCGAMASDPLAVPVLLGLGVTELSVAPVLVPTIKARVREMTVAECRSETAKLLMLGSAREVREAASARWPLE